MIVVDASALMEALLKTPSGLLIAKRFHAKGETIHAPHLVDLEITRALRRYVRSGNIDSNRGLEILEDLADFPIVRYPHSIFISRIWELRDNLTAYDAVYIALAEILDATLLTCDTGLVSAPGHHAKVKLVQAFDTEPPGKEE